MPVFSFLNSSKDDPDVAQRMIDNAQSRWCIRPGNIKIHYEVLQPALAQPQKPILVLLHGLGGSLEAWDHERVLLADQGFTTIAIDLRGHGKSDRPQKPEDYDFLVSALDIKAIIEQERVSHPVVVGHCFGGMVAIMMESTFPQTAKGLILVDTAYKSPFLVRRLASYPVVKVVITKLLERLPSLRRSSHRNFSDFKNTNDLNLRRFVSDVLHTSLRSYFLCFGQFCQYDASEVLANITVPTLIIAGTEDRIIPPSVAAELEKHISSAELAYIERANHILVLNNPQELVETIQTFLSRTDMEDEKYDQK
jgi:pimeloyl-ACP methyl ester carboxylesterase